MPAPRRGLSGVVLLTCVCSCLARFAAVLFVFLPYLLLPTPCLALVPTPQKPPRATRAPSILMTTETGLLVTEVGPAPQLFTKDGAKFYSP